MEIMFYLRLIELWDIIETPFVKLSCPTQVLIYKYMYLRDEYHREKYLNREEV